MPRLSDRPSAAASQIRHYLESADLCRATPGNLAEHYCMSRSAFERRLQRAGTTYQQLKDQERRRRLHMLVRGGRIVPKRDAETLGFVASNSFLRFFRRTMNTTLREWRRGRAAA